MRFDDEFRPGARQFVSKLLPFPHRQHDPEMAYRHIVSVNRTGRTMSDFARGQMRDDLVSVKIEIHPLG